MELETIRNIDRFPGDFMLKLTKDEATGYNPGPGQVFAFTEEEVAMLSAVLRSPVAVNVSIEIMRAFVEIRNHLAATGRLSVELAELRARMDLLQKVGEENAEDEPVQRRRIGYVKDQCSHSERS